MKTTRHSVAVLAGMILMLSISAHAADSPWEKKLPFQTATVVYKVSGTMTGNKTIYVRDFGRTTAEYSSVVMKMMGMTQKQEEMIITTPDWVYSADFTQGTGTKHVNVKKCLREEFNQLSASDQKKALKNAETMGVAIVDGMNGSMEKNVATILGYPCDRVDMMGTTAYTISGSELPLKVEGNVMGMKISQVASDLKTGLAPSSKFELPSGIHFEHDLETDRMMREQAKVTIENLVQGNNPAAENQSGPAYSSQTAQEQGQVEEVMKDDAKDVGAAAHEEAKDASVEEVREGVKNVFKSLFD